MGKRKKRVAERTDNVFKVKHKSLKKSKPTTVKNAKSVGVDTCQHVIMPSCIVRGKHYVMVRTCSMTSLFIYTINNNISQLTPPMLLR